MKPIKARIKVQAPARICFFGDHQDYLGLPVIAGTINRYIQINAIPNSDSQFFIQLLDLDKEVKRIVRKKTNQQLDRFSTIYFNKIKKDIIINEL